MPHTEKNVKIDIYKKNVTKRCTSNNKSHKC